MKSNAWHATLTPTFFYFPLGRTLWGPAKMASPALTCSCPESNPVVALSHTITSYHFLIFNSSLPGASLPTSTAPATSWINCSEVNFIFYCIEYAKHLYFHLWPTSKLLRYFHIFCSKSSKSNAYCILIADLNLGYLHFKCLISIRNRWLLFLNSIAAGMTC